MMKSKTATHKNLNNGQKTEILYPISDKEFKDQFYEVFEMEHYQKGKIKKDAVIVDLGANIGLTALYFNGWFKEYYAVEPSLACFRALQENTKSIDNIHLFNFAIGPTTGKGWLYQAVKNSVPQSFFGLDQPIFGREKVKVVQMDRFLEENKIDKVDVLKVDVESAEFIIFPSEAFKRAAGKIDCIIGEAHYNVGLMGIPQTIPIILKEYGFKTKFVKLKKPNLEHVLFYKETIDGKETEKKYVYSTSTIFFAQR